MTNDSSGGRTLIVLNPRAVGLRRPESIEPIAAAADGDQVVLLRTEYAGHGREYCRAHAQEFDKVIAVGGDGMLSEIVNGVIDCEVAVAPFPAGSGCDFIKAAAGYPATLCALLAATRSRPVDVGRITFDEGEPHFFATEAGVGMDAASIRYIPDWMRPISSKLAYDMGALGAVLFARPFPARITLDEQTVEFDRLWMLAVCSAPFFGDGMPIAPTARIDDGQFHAFAIGDVSRLDLIRRFRSVRQAQHIHDPRSVYLPCTHVEIQADRPLAMCVDGELIERTPRAWDLLPGRLRLIDPS